MKDEYSFLGPEDTVKTLSSGEPEEAYFAAFIDETRDLPLVEEPESEVMPEQPESEVMPEPKQRPLPVGTRITRARPVVLVNGVAQPIQQASNSR